MQVVTFRVVVVVEKDWVLMNTNILNNTYRDTASVYHWNEIIIDEVKSEIGLRQGCTLSPLLMIIMEELTRRIKFGLEIIEVGRKNRVRNR